MKWLLRIGSVAAAAALCISLCACGGENRSEQNDGSGSAVSEMAPTGDVKPEVTPYEEADVSLIAVGDNLIHDSVYRDMAVSDGYDFTPAYEPLAEYIAAADIAVVNQEAPMDTSKAPSGYPCFNTPTEAGDALIAAGFDVVNQANNHAMDCGSQSVYHTIAYWQEQEREHGTIMVGMYEDAEDRADIRFLEKNGMKIGFLSYTYGLNGFTLPEDNPDLVSLIDREKMREEVTAVNEACDFTVVIMHWGVEYQTTQNEEQEELAEYLTELGAGLIIGHHPHVCQPAEWIESDNGNRAFCVYSLGNFISAQKQPETMLEGMLQVTLHRDTQGNITVENPGVMPLMNQFSGWAGYQVHPLAQYTDAMAARHTVSNYGNMSVSRMNALAEEIYGEFLLGDIIPTTYCE